MLYEQATYKVLVIRLCSPGHVQIALRAILISWCRSVFTFLAHAFALPSNTSGNMPTFFGTGPPYRMRRSLGLGPFSSFAQPGDILLDLLAVGRLVRSALLHHRRLLQADEDRGLEALQNVA